MKTLHHSTNKIGECMDLIRNSFDYQVLSLGRINLSIGYMMSENTVLCENCFDTNIITKGFWARK